MNTTSSTSTLPGCHNICYYKSDTWKETIRLRDYNKDPIDLSDAIPVIHIKVKKTDTTPAETLTLGDGLEIVSVDLNEIDVDKILTLVAGIYYWDLQITFADGGVRTILAGDFAVVQDVTQPAV